MKKNVLTVFVVLLCACFQLWSAENKGKVSEAIATAQLVEDAFAEVVEIAKPAVVVISNKQVQSYFRRGMDMMPDEFFDFFNIPRGYERDGRDGMRGGSKSPQIVGRGSGIIIRNDGYILTNYHVIKDNEYLEVKTADGTVYDNMEDPKSVQVIGYDEESDLAVLQIGKGKKKDYPALKFADSDKLRVGQWAIAIGAPFNLDYSVTIGCISQKGRTEMGMSNFDSYIQTDASINPGNSGGPLLNIKGEIIGVNQFIMTGGASKGSIGLGFAIASNLANQIAESLIEHGEVNRPFIGISMQELNKAFKEQYGLDHGVIVREVIPGEAAEAAGIKAGDIILEVGGQKVFTSHELLMEVTKYKPGDAIKLTILRSDKNIEISVKARKRESYLNATGKRLPRNGENGGNMMERLGLRLTESEGKVIVNGVIPNGAADKAGTKNDDKIQRGDVIIEINKTPVSSISDVRNVMDNMKNRTVIMYLERRGRMNNSIYRYFVAIPLTGK